MSGNHYRVTKIVQQGEWSQRPQFRFYPDTPEGKAGAIDYVKKAERESNVCFAKVEHVTYSVEYLYNHVDPGTSTTDRD